MAVTKKNTSRVSRASSAPDTIGFTAGVENTNITSPGTAAGSTQYDNKPVTGGNTEVIINDIIVRSPVRVKQDIASWRAALMGAESRYYPNRTRLYDIYADVSLDGHLSGLLNKRISSVLNTPIFFHDKDGKEVEGMEKLTQSYEFRKILREIMLTQFWGITGFEFIPGNELTVRLIPRKHIKTKTQLISIEQNIQDEGFDYTRLDNVWVIGEPEDLGLFNICTPYVLYKRGAMADWANFIEIFGQPMRVAKYDPFDKTTEAALKSTIENTGSMLALMIPKTADFEIVDGKTGNANGDLQNKYITSINQEVSIIVLGNTETTSNSGTGSQAKSKTHQSEQREITKSDIAYVTTWLNHPHFLAILRSYGLPVPDGGRFTFKTEIDVTYLAQRAIIDKTLRDSGLPIADDYFYDAYEIPKPDNYDQMKADMKMEEEEEEPVANNPDKNTPPVKSAPKKKKAQETDRPATIADVRAMFNDFFGPAR